MIIFAFLLDDIGLAFPFLRTYCLIEFMVYKQLSGASHVLALI